MTKVAPLVNHNTIPAAAENGVFFITWRPWWIGIQYWHLAEICVLYPSLIRRPRSLSSLSNFAARSSARKLESWGYSVVKVAWS